MRLDGEWIGCISRAHTYPRMMATTAKCHVSTSRGIRKVLCRRVTSLRRLGRIRAAEPAQITFKVAWLCLAKRFYFYFCDAVCRTR